MSWYTLYVQGIINRFIVFNRGVGVEILNLKIIIIIIIIMMVIIIKIIILTKVQ